MVKYIPHCKRCKDKNYLIECGDGCGQLLFKRNKWIQTQTYIHGHHPPKHKYHCGKCKDRNYLIKCACGKCEEHILKRGPKFELHKYAPFHHLRGKPSNNFKNGNYIDGKGVSCYNCLDKSWIIECKCECGEILTRRDSRGRYREYEYNHHSKGSDNYFWTKGRYQNDKGYIFIWKPNHPKCNNQGYVLEHRLVYEEYHKCCLLPWIEIHHKNEITSDNRIENLKPVTHKEHMQIHMTGNQIRKGSGLDRSNTFCSQCNSKETYINKKGRPVWFNDGNGGNLCNRCYNHLHKDRSAEYQRQYKKRLKEV